MTLTLTSPKPQPMLSVSDLHAWYGDSHILQGMSFDVHEGEVVTLLGRNGAGKSTTLNAVMGIIRKRRGSVVVKGVETIDIPSRRIARLGIGYVPEDRGIYSTLSVKENLLLPPAVGSGGLSIDEITELFPNLRDRLSSSGTALSGGEQQMLSIGRVLRTGARLLIMDEPTEGLAPVIVQQIERTIRRLRQLDFTLLLVEQNRNFATRVADRHYVVEHGQVVDMLTAADLTADADRLNRYLSV